MVDIGALLNLLYVLTVGSFVAPMGMITQYCPAIPTYNIWVTRW